MGDNIGFLLPAWLLGAPLVLAIGDLMINGKLEHVTGSDTVVSSRTPIKPSHPTATTPNPRVAPLQRETGTTPHA